MAGFRNIGFDMRKLALAMLLWLGLASVAAAHASLTATEPQDGAVVDAPPARYALSYNEPVSPISLRLIKPDGTSVSLDKFVLRDRTLDIEAPTDLKHGTHVLSWRVISEDGHPVGGSVVFSIGEASAAPPPVPELVDWQVRAGLWLSKLALYIGLFIGIGGVFAFSWLASGERAGTRLVGAALGIGLVGTIASAGFQGLDVLGAPVSRFFDPAIWSAGMGTSFGRTVAVMIGAIVLSGLALLARSEALARWLSLAGLLTGALALSLSGHASAAEPQWLTRPSVFLHASAIAIWTGALLPLGLGLRAGDAGSVTALRRFSACIPYAVVVLVVAGIALAVIQVQTPQALLDTAYGNVLLVKLALLAVLFGLAAFNRWRLTRPCEAGDAQAVRRLVRSIAAETAIVLMVFAVVACWRFTPPPRALAIAAAQPASTHIHTEKAMADVTVTPGRAGPVTVSAIIMTGDFGALDAKEVSFVFSNPAAGIQPIKRKAMKPGDGSWRASDLVLPLPGTWNVRVDILISDFDIARIEGKIDIRP
ncbi:copper transport protein [Mesorhizobium soli]|jgi:copper transport protein|uniref:copper resistance CopC/CopD family protein n=1 Tax=Pseudaminobacter soli (ex Li et al. 2025) TaxID=1295366 RepID=UPI002475A437|nr:copper resistance CopC/CopD family protein [Mesorhizobium soli]MDH6233448.1 copper transport protein [Mesorhizobium soli]